MLKTLTQYRCDLSSTGIERLKCKYDPEAKIVLKNGVIVSNNGAGYPYSIKLEHNKIYSFDLNIPEQAFTVERLAKYLVEVGTLEKENKKVTNDIESIDSTGNTKEISTKTKDKKTNGKVGKTKKDNKVKEDKVKDKDNKKEVESE